MLQFKILVAIVLKSSVPAIVIEIARQVTEVIIGWISALFNASLKYTTTNLSLCLFIKSAFKIYLDYRKPEIQISKNFLSSKIDEKPPKF